MVKKVIEERFDKTLLPGLPKVAFDGRIIEVCDTPAADKAVDYLLAQPILGFDTETKPSFAKGRSHKVALLQVSTRDTCFLFRLCRMGIPDSVARLLGDNTVTKTALSWRDDVCSLTRRRKFECGEFIELQTYAARLGIKDMSLQKLYANVMGGRISKTQQLSNWEREQLTEAQKLYAATDAWACVMLFVELHRLLETGDYELHIQDAAS